MPPVGESYQLIVPAPEPVAVKEKVLGLQFETSEITGELGRLIVMYAVLISVPEPTALVAVRVTV